MKKKKCGSWFFIALGAAVILSGMALCWFAAREINNAVEAESAQILHEPVMYISGVRDTVKDMTYVIAMGVCVMIFGSIVLSVSVARLNVLRNEGVAIKKLESRIEKLERSAKR